MGSSNEFQGGRVKSFFLIFLYMSFFHLDAFAAASKKEAFRTAVRDWVISHASLLKITAAPEGNDLASELVDHLAHTNLAQMEVAGLLQAELENSPWSDSYWPTYAGQIANRYADPNFSMELLWKDNSAYLRKHVGKGDSKIFSPAEKYDLLVGDSAFTLSHKMIEAGAPFADERGKVETWFGLCHGWAPASFMLPRPAHSVKVKSARGQDIVFTPSDIKALGTLLWASGAGQTKFVGGRCNKKDPDRDSSSREMDPECFDTNPATWHLVVVNQIGVEKKSFIMDASAGYEVWNQPIEGYYYAYTNPLTGMQTKKLSEAKVLRKDLVNDPYASHRNPATEAVVGISMSVSYISENSPSPDLVDSAEMDSRSVVVYQYDLELDRDDNIIGGEWHSGTHPDFLWAPFTGSEASSAGDEWLNSRNDTSVWSGNAPLPALWQKAAKGSSAQEQPLARVVKTLFRLANQPVATPHHP